MKINIASTPIGIESILLKFVYRLNAIVKTMKKALR